MELQLFEIKKTNFIYLGIIFQGLNIPTNFWRILFQGLLLQIPFRLCN